MRGPGDRVLNLCLAATAALALAAPALAGCSSCGKPDGPPPGEAPAALEEKVPAPDDLLADGVALTPNATWGRIQRGVGGALGLMPQTTGSVMCSLAGVDLAMGPEIDGTSPVYFALAGEVEAPAWIVVAKLVELRKARGVLLESETAKYTGREEGSLTVLTPKGGAAGAAAPVGVGITRSGYFVVAKDAATLTRLAPYATRTLPRESPPRAPVHVEVRPKALAGRLRPLLERRWQATMSELLESDAKMRSAHGGRAPDFAEPKAIVAVADGLVQRRLGALGAIEKLGVDLEASDEDVHIAAELVGEEGDGGLSPMTVGSTSPLLDVPKDAIAALLTRSAPEERAADAKDIEAALLTTLGPRLPEAEAAKLRSAIGGFARGRGDALTLVALGGERKAKGLVLRTPVSAKDAELARRSVSDAADLLRAPAFKDPLRLKKVARTTGDAKGVGKCDVLEVLIEGKGKLPDTKLGLAWEAEGGMLCAALGDDPLELVARASRPEQKLSDEKTLAAYVEALGKEASFVLLGQPFLVDQSKPVPTAPAVLAWGARGETRATRRWVRLDVSDRVLRELMKKQLGL